MLRFARNDGNNIKDEIASQPEADRNDRDGAMAMIRAPYEVSYRDIKYPRMELRTGRLHLILPPGHVPDVLVKKHKTWISQKEDFIERCLKESSLKKIAKRTDAEFKELLGAGIAASSQRLGVKARKVFIRKMKTKWASLSPKRNLTVNTLMKYLPASLLKYVIFHEMAHLIEKRHNERFWGIISRVFRDYRRLELDLFAYWFKVNERPSSPSPLQSP